MKSTTKLKARELAAVNSRAILFEFLFQTNKEFRMEELINRDTQEGKTVINLCNY